jgi:hypothetical protein
LLIYYNKKQIKILTSFIEKNYDDIEDKTMTAIDLEGNYFITWEKIKQTGNLEASVNN